MRLRQLLRKIHRWVGLLSALWLLQLAVTGLLLQHADEFGLGQRYVSNSTVLSWFDYGKKQQAWESSQGVLYQVDNMVIIGNQKTEINAPIVSVINNNEVWVVATSSNVTWLNNQAEVIQQTDDFDGLPTPVKGISLVKGQLQVSSEQGSFLYSDSGDFVTTPIITLDETPESTIKQAIIARDLTNKESGVLLPLTFENQLSYDKVIYAIHSGFKSVPLLNTLSALALIYLSLSGIYLFIKPSFRRKGKQS